MDIDRVVAEVTITNIINLALVFGVGYGTYKIICKSGRMNSLLKLTLIGLGAVLVLGAFLGDEVKMASFVSGLFMIGMSFFVDSKGGD